MRYIFSLAIACLLFSLAASESQAQVIFYRSRPVMTAGPGSNYPSVYYYRTGGFSYGGYTAPYTITRYPTSISTVQYGAVAGAGTRIRTNVTGVSFNLSAASNQASAVAPPRMRADRYAYTIRGAAFGGGIDERGRISAPAGHAVAPPPCYYCPH